MKKNDCDIWNLHPKICRNAKKKKKKKKKKCTKQNKKNKQTQIGSKIPYLGVLGCNFEKVLSCFQQPRICQFVKMQSFAQNEK